jgi:hypothetical protein
MARPPTYHSDEERPATVSVRIPQDLYGQAKQYASMRRLTLTELLLDGLRLRLDTPADPRDILVSQENTVIQEWEAMVDARIEAALVRERTLTPPFALPMLAPEVSYDDKNTVIQGSSRAAAAPKGAKPQPGASVPFKDQVLAVVTAQGPLTCDAVADAVHAPHKKTWRVLQELIAEGLLRREGTRERTVYQWA